MNLVFSKSTGHVKVDGAVVGRVTIENGRHFYCPFSWSRRARVLSGTELPALLRLVRTEIEESMK